MARRRSTDYTIKLSTEPDLKGNASNLRVYEFQPPSGSSPTNGNDFQKTTTVTSTPYPMKSSVASTATRKTIPPAPKVQIIKKYSYNPYDSVINTTKQAPNATIRKKSVGDNTQNIQQNYSNKPQQNIVDYPGCRSSGVSQQPNVKKYSAGDDEGSKIIFVASVRKDNTPNIPQNNSNKTQKNVVDYPGCKSFGVSQQPNIRKYSVGDDNGSETIFVASVRKDNAQNIQQNNSNKSQKNNNEYPGSRTFGVSRQQNVRKYSAGDANGSEKKIVASVRKDNAQNIQQNNSNKTQKNNVDHPGCRNFGVLQHTTVRKYSAGDDGGSEKIFVASVRKMSINKDVHVDFETFATSKTSTGNNDKNAARHSGKTITITTEIKERTVKNETQSSTYYKKIEIKQIK